MTLRLIERQISKLETRLHSLRNARRNSVKKTSSRLQKAASVWSAAAGIISKKKAAAWNKRIESERARW